MRILLAFEYSGVESAEFRKRGHTVLTCDLLPTEGDPRFHYQGDARDLLEVRWDMIIAHVPCTEFSVSGARWRTDHWVISKKNGTHWIERDGKRVRAYWHDGAPKRALQKEALELAMAFANAPVEKLIIENPISELSSLWRPADQIVSPWWFGDPEQKQTALWLKGVPKLVKTNDVYEEMMKRPKRERESGSGPCLLDRTDNKNAAVLFLAWREHLQSSGDKHDRSPCNKLVRGYGAHMSIRYFVERKFVKALLTKDDRWTRESIAGRKTIHAARRELAEFKSEGAPWQEYRIVKVTTTRRVVK